MKLTTRLLTVILLFVVFLASSIRPILAIGGPFIYFRDIYIPAIYDDPNINLQKHIKETIATIPSAMFDLGFGIIFPSGAKVIRDCLDAATKGVFPPWDASGKINDTLNCGKDWAEIPTQAKTPTVNLATVALPTDSRTTAFPSTVNYLADSFSSFIPKASAQGFGYRSYQGSPVLSLWRGVRNITYVLSSLILIITGIMIMFRVKISPQAVITIEQAIPKLAITLLLITFSYAIVGFVIDLYYIASYLTAFLLKGANIQLGPAGAILGLFGVSDKIWSDPKVAYTIFFENPIFANVFSQYFIAAIVSVFGFMNVMVANSVPPSNPGTAPLGALILIFYILIMIIFVLIILINMFRIFFSLLKVYFGFIVRIIAGPLIILMGLLPGNFGGFGTWLTGLIQDVVTFFATSLVFLLAITFFLATGSGSNWIPPQLGMAKGELALFLAGLGALLAVPSVPNMVKSFFAKKPFDLGTAIGESTKVVQGAAMTGGAGATGSFVDYAHKQGWTAAEWMAKYLGGSIFKQCLSASSLIATPNGPALVSKLKIGMLVWTVNHSGERAAVPIIKIVNRAVPQNHPICHLTLSDQRELWVSPNHPTSDERTINQIETGEYYDGATLVSNTLENYTSGKTYDLLPAGDTGYYWANGILVGSTLKPNLLRHLTSLGLTLLTQTPTTAPHQNPNPSLPQP